MIKKTLSVLLAVMMVVSVLTVGVVTSNAATTDGFTPDPAKLYFDIEGAVDSTGTSWADLMGTKGKVAFYICGGDLDTEANPTKPIAWGGKKAIGTATAGETGVFEFDPAAKLGTLTDGVQYKLIFVRVDGANWKEQTYDLFFTTDCLGHIAKCDGTFTENPVDSSKKTATAYWDDSIDPSENGPVKGITSIGNVVGSCIEGGKSDYDLMKEFFTEEKTDFQGKTSYQNAHGYVCEISEESPNYKSEQQLIDDIGEGLSLTKDDVKSILEDEEVQAKLAETPGCAWNYDDSTLPSSTPVHTHTPGEPVIENDNASTCTQAGSYDEVVYCTECKEEISRETKYHDLAPHTPGEPVIENDTASTCTQAGSYDEVVYCTVCKGEISRETKYHDLAPHTPGDPEITNVVEPGCETAGSHDEIVKCTVCEQQLDEYCHIGVVDPATGHEDPLTYVPEVPATASVDGVKAHYTCTKCGKLYADADGAVEVTADELVIKAEHVRGDADGDGTFDLTDVTILQRKLVEMNVESFDAIAADADLDGVVDVLDVTLMQRVQAKMTTWEKWDERHPKADN